MYSTYILRNNKLLKTHLIIGGLLKRNFKSNNKSVLMTNNDNYTIVIIHISTSRYYEPSRCTE